MAERNALMPGRGLPRESNALAPDMLADGSPDPNATEGWQQLYRNLTSPTDWRGVGSEYANALLMGSTAPGRPGFRAFHGSPHSFERFDLGKIGTGEGAQAYGHGLYFAGNEGTARYYRDYLAGTKLDFPTKATESLFNSLPPHLQANLQRQLEGGASPADIRFTLQQIAGGARSHLAAVEAGGRGSGANYGTDVGATATAAEQLAAAKQMPKSVSAGHMYEVNINADPEHFLHWDKPLSEQHPKVQEALGTLGIKPHDYSVRQSGDGYVVDYQGKTSRAFQTADEAQRAANETAKMQGLDPTGGQIYESSKIVPGDYRNPAAAAQALQEAGIPGIRYLDQGSRGAGEGTHNLVVFDPATIEILRKYGLAGLGLGGAAAGAAQQSDGSQ